MKLYELTGQVAEVMALVESGELEQDQVADTLEALGLELNAKAASVAHYILNLSPMVDGIDAEIKRLQDRKAAIQKRQDGLKDYLHFNMEKSGINKIECDLFTITKRKPRKVVVIDDEEKVPNKYLGYKTQVSVRKDAVKQAIESGKHIEGASLVDGKTSITIK